MKTQNTRLAYYATLLLSTVSTSIAMDEAELRSRCVTSYRSSQTLAQEALVTVQVQCLARDRVIETTNFYYIKNDNNNFSTAEILKNCQSIWHTLDSYYNNTWVEIRAHRKNIENFQIRGLVDRDDNGILLRTP